MILVDSGPLIAAAIASDRDHRHFRNVRPRHVDYLTLLP